MLAHRTCESASDGSPRLFALEDRCQLYLAQTGWTTSQTRSSSLLPVNSATAASGTVGCSLAYVVGKKPWKTYERLSNSVWKYGESKVCRRPSRVKKSRFPSMPELPRVSRRGRRYERVRNQGWRHRASAAVMWPGRAKTSWMRHSSASKRHP